MHQEEIELQVLRSIGKVTSQRTIADRFVNSDNKIQYKYLLTPSGIKEKITLTDKFIEIKKEEYDKLQNQKKEYEEMYDLSNLKKAHCTK